MKRRKRWIASLTATCALAVACIFGAAVLPAASTAKAETQGFVESFDFTKATDFSALDAFSVGIDPATNSEPLGYTSDSWVTYAKELDEMFTLDNGLKIKGELYSGNDVSENNVYVRYNVKKLQYFTAELVYSYDDETRDGWAGFMFGYTNFSRKARWGDSPAGVEMFVQKSGKGTYSSSKLNNTEYTEGAVPENWTEKGEHTLRITAIGSGVTLTADGIDVITIDAALMRQKNYELASAHMGFYFTNAVFTAKKFSVSPLNEAGDPYQAVESVSVTAAAQIAQFAPLSVQSEVLPANASMKAVGYILPDGAIADGNTIYFVKPGDYTVTAYAIDDPAKTDEFTVKVTAAENYFNYPTTAEAAAKNFDNYFVTNGGSKDGASFPVTDYWNFNADGSMTLKEKKKSGVDAGYVLLYLKDLVNGLAVESNCFELSYMVKSELSTPNGWHGVGLSLGDRATVPNQEGISAFIQEEALKVTVWGSGVGGVGGPNELDSAYGRGEWNFVKVRVYGEGSSFKIEMYVNDMKTPAISATARNLPARELALFTTTTITFANINYAKLDKNGTPTQIVYPESVKINTKFENVESGDKVQIEAGILPAAVTESGLLYSSSNALVATVNATGMITFLNAGETTLTVKCKGNPAVKDEVKISVKDREVLPAGVSFDATPKEATVGGKYMLLVTVTPDNATNYNVRFTSSNESVATVDQDGRLTYVGAGETVITVICKADENIKASFNLTVKAAENGNSQGSSAAGGGCGSFIGASGVTGAVAFAAGITVLLRKKKK